jgi:hypothetical protein
MAGLFLTVPKHLQIAIESSEKCGDENWAKSTMVISFNMKV